MKSFQFSKVTLGTIHGFTPVVLNKQVNQTLAAGGFSGTGIEAWPGASRIFALQKLLLPGYAFSIQVGQKLRYTNFVLTVKWLDGNVVKRYKLWQNVGELLAYPLYAGEIIPGVGAELEYWTTANSTSTTVVPPLSLICAILENPTTCCDQTGIELANGICPIGSPITLNGMFYQCV